MKATDVISSSLKGRYAKIMTDAKVEVFLQIESVKPDHRSRDLEPATRENDWWPKSENWTVYIVNFTNGYQKEYRNLDDINIAEEVPNDKKAKMRKSANDTLTLLIPCDPKNNLVKSLDEMCGYVLELTNTP